MSTAYCLLRLYVSARRSNRTAAPSRGAAGSEFRHTGKTNRSDRTQRRPGTYERTKTPFLPAPPRPALPAASPTRVRCSIAVLDTASSSPSAARSLGGSRGYLRAGLITTVKLPYLDILV